VVRVVLADDHAAIRLGVRTVLAAEADVDVQAEVADGLEVLPAVERLRPDVLVLDLMMPSLHGLEVLRQIAQRAPQTRVVVYSMWSSEAYVFQALRHGALGYVLKSGDVAELTSAVRCAAAGRRYFSPPITEKALEAYAERARETPPDPYDTLTAREREVLLMAAASLANGEIAGRLCISVRTVETHRAHAMRKLHLRTHTDLVRFALQRGLLPPDGTAADGETPHGPPCPSQ